MPRAKETKKSVPDRPVIVLENREPAPPYVSLVIPTYNEEEVFGELVNRVRAVFQTLNVSYEIVFVDDGSTDSTRAKIKASAEQFPEIKAVFFSRNFGHQSAVTAGLSYARGSAVIIMDADLQDPPELIPKMLELFKSGSEVVYGVRTKRKENIFKKISYKVYYMLVKKMTNSVDLPLDSGDFSLVSRNVVSVLNSLKEKNRYIRGLRAWVGFKQTPLVYERDARYAGEPKYDIKRLIKLAYDGIFSFSYVPITIVTAIGIVSSLAAFVGILVIIAIKIFSDWYIPGLASTSIFVLFIGGIQLFSIGIVGEYVKRIYDETKDRPHYIVSHKINL